MRTPRILIAAAACAIALVVSGCSAAETVDGQESVVRVPADASLEEAGEMVADGGVVLIAAGTYNATLEVAADDVTIRGEDRDGVILDGELSLSSGVVATGERVAVENLPVRNYLQNGVLITGVTDENGAGIARGPDGYVPEDAPALVPGYLVQRVTASNNGLYGIYAFNRSDGVIRENVATGGSDSGIYVGQCDECGALLEGNVVSRNAVGIELANASGVVVTGNRVDGNRIGVSVLSNYLEAHGPSRGVQIVGNVIVDNDEDQTPVHANGAFGIGVGLSGTVDAEVARNRITGNDNVGVWISSSEDFAPDGNLVSGGAYEDNGLDIAYTPSVAGGANCFAVDGARTEPAGLADTDCAEPTPVGRYALPTAPEGIAFSNVALPGPQEGLAEVDETPREVPDTVRMPDLEAIEVPGPGLLAGILG